MKPHLQRCIRPAALAGAVALPATEAARAESSLGLMGGGGGGVFPPRPPVGSFGRVKMPANPSTHTHTETVRGESTLGRSMESDAATEANRKATLARLAANAAGASAVAGLPATRALPQQGGQSDPRFGTRFESQPAARMPMPSAPSAFAR